MSEPYDFRRYAIEAVQAAFQAKTTEEKMALLDLARVWQRAAQRSQEMTSAAK